MSTRAPFAPTKEAHGGRKRAEYTRERIDTGGGKTAGDLLPTAGEKDALAGTSGTPSKSNKYVANADARNADQRDAKSLQGRTVATDAPAEADVLTFDAAQARWEPRVATGGGGGATNPASEILRAAASADLTLTTAAQDIAGATVTLNKAGLWFLVGVFYVDVDAAGTGQMIGELVAAAVTQGGQATVGFHTGEHTIVQVWKFTAAINDIAKLQAWKTVNDGTLAVRATHTTLTAVFVGGPSEGTLPRTVLAEVTGTPAAEGAAGHFNLRDAQTDILHVRFEVPKDYASGALTFRFYFRNGATTGGNVRLTRDRYRMRDAAAFVTQESGVATTVAAPGAASTTFVHSFTVPAADFLAADVIIIDQQRLGSDALDTHAGTIECDAVVVEYTAKVTQNPAPIWEQIWEAFDANADPVDKLISSGAYRVFIFFSSQNAAAWKTPTNAVYTVPTGKKLLVISKVPSEAVAEDTANRQARFRNVTDATDVLAPGEFQGAGAGFPPWTGDVATASKLTEVPTGKQVRVELWNADATKRAMGALVICREVTA